MTISMPDFADLVAQHCPKPQVIIEVGALDALDSELLRTRFPDARVVAIEGHPTLYETHRPYVSQAIEYVHAIIGKKSEERPFYLKTSWGVSGLYDRGSEYGTDSQLVTTTTLVAICAGLGISEVSVIKIDVEGATLDALEGMGSLLNTVQIMHIETETIEYFKGQALHHQVVQFLVNAGFIPIAMSGVLGQHQYDSVWVRR